MQYKNTHKTYGISPGDFKILNLLTKNSVEDLANTATKISEILKIPRTTILFRLKDLETRKIVESNKTCKGRFWSVTNIGKNILTETEKENLKVESVNSLDSIIQIFESVLQSKSNERLYVIEPSLQVLNYTIKTNAENYVKLNKKILELFKSNDHISEAVSGESALENLKNLDKETLKSMWGRATIITLVPDECVTFTDYIIVYFGKVYFMDFINEKAIIVNDVNFAESMKSIIKNLQKFGKVINLNEEIKKILMQKFDFKIN
jgi:DNA-binding Lrp family transcriptional regulator